MRIISKFKDYYDIGMSQGQDDDLVFCRVQEEHVKVRNVVTNNTDRELQLFDLVGRSNHRYFDTETFIIGFCGVVYKAIKMSYSVIGSGQKYERWCYTIDDVNDFIMHHPLDEARTAFYEKTKSRRSKWYSRFSVRHLGASTEDHFISSFKALDSVKDSYMSSFRNYNTPCFVFKKEGIRDRFDQVVVNPCLKDYNFQKVCDSYSAYQEISMFIGGILGKGEKETLGRKDFPDEPLIRDSKGFDNWSFKKRPTK